MTAGSKSVEAQPAANGTVTAPTAANEAATNSSSLGSLCSVRPGWSGVWVVWAAPAFAEVAGAGGSGVAETVWALESMSPGSP